MPRTITIDNIEVTQLRFAKDADGVLHVYAEYKLKSGSQLVQASYDEISARLNAGRKTAIQAMFNSIADDLAAQLA